MQSSVAVIYWLTVTEIIFITESEVKLKLCM